VFLAVCFLAMQGTADGDAAPDPVETQVVALAGLAQDPTCGHLDEMIGALDSENDAVSNAAFDALATWIDRNPELAWKARIEPSLGECRQLSAAARLLGKLDTPAARTVLRRMLASSCSALQSAALDGYFEGGDVDDRHALRALLQPTYAADVRRKASLVLGRLEDSESIPDLIEALGDEDHGYASNARWALEQITGEQLAADPELWSAWWTGASKETLAKLGRPHLPRFVEQRARRTLEGLRHAAVDDAVACARVDEQFGVDDATVKSWLDELDAAQAPAPESVAKSDVTEGAGSPESDVSRRSSSRRARPKTVRAAFDDASPSGRDSWLACLLGGLGAAAFAGVHRMRSRR
jgi:hypothetical protein